LSEVESLAQSKTGLRHLQLMSTLSEFKPLDNNRQVGVTRLFDEAKEQGLPRESVTGGLEALQDRGWLWFEKMNAGIQTVVLNQAGVDAADEFKSLRADARRRTREIRSAVLEWLYDLHVLGQEPSGIEDFLESLRNSFLGRPYSPRELERATEWLMAEELIEAILTFGGGYARPEITNKGIAVVEDDGSINQVDPAAGGDTYNITNSGAFNWAQNSSNVTQSNTMTQEHVDNIERVLGSVRAMLNPMVLGVSEETTTQAQVIANQVDEEIHTQAPDGGKVKALLLKLVDLAATGSVQGGVDALNTMMQQGIAGL
jgi:hypothetical protein